MIYLYWYLALGVVTLVLIALAHHLTKKKDTEPLRDLLPSIFPERRKLWNRLLDDVIGPGLIGMLIVPFWPIIFFFKIKHLIVGEPETPPLDEPEFAVTRADLLTKISIADIEQHEMVIDPLGAAPNLPFGHLNAVWRKFIDAVQPADHIWTFVAKRNQWAHIELREGYVIVRNDEISSHFLTMWKYLEEGIVVANSKQEKPVFDLAAWLRKQVD